MVGRRRLRRGGPAHASPLLALTALVLLILTALALLRLTLLRLALRVLATLGLALLSLTLSALLLFTTLLCFHYQGRHVHSYGTEEIGNLVSSWRPLGAWALLALALLSLRVLLAGFALRCRNLLTLALLDSRILVACCPGWAC